MPSNAHARVIHQRVDWPQFLTELLDERGHTVGVGQIICREANGAGAATRGIINGLAQLGAVFAR